MSLLSIESLAPLALLLASCVCAPDAPDPNEPPTARVPPNALNATFNVWCVPELLEVDDPPQGPNQQLPPIEISYDDLKDIRAELDSWSGQYTVPGPVDAIEAFLQEIRDASNAAWHVVAIGGSDSVTLAPVANRSKPIDGLWLDQTTNLWFAHVVEEASVGDAPNYPDRQIAYAVHNEGNWVVRAPIVVYRKIGIPDTATSIR